MVTEIELRGSKGRSSVLCTSQEATEHATDDCHTIHPLLSLSLEYTKGTKKACGCLQDRKNRKYKRHH